MKTQMKMKNNHKSLINRKRRSKNKSQRKNPHKSLLCKSTKPHQKANQVKQRKQLRHLKLQPKHQLKAKKRKKNNDDVYLRISSISYYFQFDRLVKLISIKFHSFDE